MLTSIQAPEAIEAPSITKQAARLATEAAALRDKILGVWSGATRFAETLEGGWACQHLAEAYHGLDHAASGLNATGQLQKDALSHKGSTVIEAGQLTGRFSALSDRLLQDQRAVCRVARRLLKLEGYLKTEQYSDDELLSPHAVASVRSCIALAKELIELAIVSA